MKTEALQAHLGGQRDGIVVGLLIAAVGHHSGDDLIDRSDQILVALGNDDGFAEGGFLGGELELGHGKGAVAVGDDGIAHGGVDHQTGNVADGDLKGQFGILVQLEELAVGQGLGDELGLDGALLGADLQPGQRFRGGVFVKAAMPIST